MSAALRDAYYEAKASEFVDGLPMGVATGLFSSAELTELSGAGRRLEVALLEWAESDGTTVDQIEVLQRHGLYNICFRNAGVGCMFYEGPEHPAEWRKHLVVHHYYPGIRQAVDAEIERLRNG